MSDIHPGLPRDDADEPRLTVEDAGSTTDPAELVGAERAQQHDAAFTPDDSPTADEPTADEPVATEPVETGPDGAGRPNNLSSLLGDDSIGHVFDQTNGVVAGLDGDSDGSAESDVLDAQERADENPDLFHDAVVRGVGPDDSRITGN